VQKVQFWQFWQLWQKVQKVQKVQFWQLWQKVQFLQKWGAPALHPRGAQVPCAGRVLPRPYDDPGSDPP
jgi:hypothetical protein